VCFCARIQFISCCCRSTLFYCNPWNNRICIEARQAILSPGAWETKQSLAIGKNSLASPKIGDPIPLNPKPAQACGDISRLYCRRYLCHPGTLYTSPEGILSHLEYALSGRMAKHHDRRSHLLKLDEVSRVKVQFISILRPVSSTSKLILHPHPHHHNTTIITSSQQQ
jgi:hypothetical protein